MRDRNLLQYIIIALKGMAMGAADVVPGVSGGTIAFISGIYEELITSINNINFSLIKIGLLYISSYTQNAPIAELLKWRSSLAGAYKFPSALACKRLALN